MAFSGSWRFPLLPGLRRAGWFLDQAGKDNSLFAQQRQAARDPVKTRLPFKGRDLRAGVLKPDAVFVAADKD